MSEPSTPQPRMLSENLTEPLYTPSPWVYCTYKADVSASALGPLKNFMILWRSKWKHNSSFPTWRDFRFMEFEDWWGQLSLAELHNDPFDLRWALWGTKISDWWGSDYTNRFISQIPEVHDVFQRHEKPYLEHLVKHRQIGFFCGNLAPQNRNYLSICGVDLPLETHGAITHILSAYVLTDPDEPFEPDVVPEFQIF